MPIYEYKCRTCNHVFEKMQSVGADGSDLTCPECNTPAPEKQFSAFASSMGGASGIGSSYSSSSSGCGSSGFG